MKYIACEKCKYNYEGECDFYNMGSGNEIDMPCYREKELIKKEWIPVMERMPEDGQNVLFCDIENDIMLGYHIKGRPNTHFSQDGTFDDIKNVKAWMPLPEPYEAYEEWMPQYEGKWVAESEGVQNKKHCDSCKYLYDEYDSRCETCMCSCHEWLPKWEPEEVENG